MDFRQMCDNIDAMACVVSVEIDEDGNCKTVRLVDGNQKYIDTIEKPMKNAEMLTDKFVPNTEYTNYLTRDLNFENSSYQAAVLKKCIHSYANPERVNVWFSMSFIPLSYSEGNVFYCLYLMEINLKLDAKRMLSISPEIATSVLETCIKLRQPDDFRVIMNDVCEDIRDLCDSEHCCVLLMDTERRKCSILCEALSRDTDLLPMSNYVDDAFYDIADSWKDTIGGSNCLIIKNDHDMEIVRERNPVWVDSITGAGGKTIVLFPLKFKGELLGYIWAINFRDEKADSIKETLELTTFVLASEIYSNNMIERLHILSSRDMLTGVLNRNEMNIYVDELVKYSRNESVGVLFADLNGLKVVNDTMGHSSGDQLLKNAADVLKSVFHRREIFRAGGDEFVVILISVTEEELRRSAETIKNASKGYSDLSFAIGLAFEEDSVNVRKALRDADVRMYEDKKNYYSAHPAIKSRMNFIMEHINED